MKVPCPFCSYSYELEEDGKYQCGICGNRYYLINGKVLTPHGANRYGADAVIVDRFRVIGELFPGSNEVMYCCVDELLGKLVCLKDNHPEEGYTKVNRNRFVVVGGIPIPGKNVLNSGEMIMFSNNSEEIVPITAPAPIPAPAPAIELAPAPVAPAPPPVAPAPAPVAPAPPPVAPAPAIELAPAPVAPAPAPVAPAPAPVAPAPAIELAPAPVAPAPPPVAPAPAIELAPAPVAPAPIPASAPVEPVPADEPAPVVSASKSGIELSDSVLKEPERKKGCAGKVILWIFLILVLAVLIGGGVLYYKYPELCIEKYNCCKAEIKRVIFKQVPAAAEKTESNAAPAVAEKTEDKVVPAVPEKKAEDKSVPAGVEKPESKVAPAAAEKVGSISGDRN